MTKFEHSSENFRFRANIFNLDTKFSIFKPKLFNFGAKILNAVKNVRFRSKIFNLRVEIWNFDQKYSIFYFVYRSYISTSKISKIFLHEKMRDVPRVELKITKNLRKISNRNNWDSRVLALGIWKDKTYYCFVVI